MRVQIREYRFWIFLAVVAALSVVAVAWRLWSTERRGDDVLFPVTVTVGSGIRMKSPSAQAIWVYHEFKVAEGQVLTEVMRTCPNDGGASISVIRDVPLFGAVTVYDSDWGCEVKGKNLELTFDFKEEGRYFFVFILSGSSRPDPGLGFDRDLEELQKWGLQVKVFETEAVAATLPPAPAN